MDICLEQARKEVADVFNNEAGVQFLMPSVGMGLSITFNNEVDLFATLGIQKVNNVRSHTGFYDLVAKYGVAVLNNCKISNGDHIALSKGINTLQTSAQDPFHRDSFDRPDFITLIRDDKRQGRDEPTYYALEDDVMVVIRKILELDKTPWLIKSALKPLISNDYQFKTDAVSGVSSDRIRLQRDYPHFVSDVFNFIPEGKKCCVDWPSGIARVAAHANVGQILHARPAGKRGVGPYEVNCLTATEIERIPR